jgi:hypothetical protein
MATAKVDDLTVPASVRDLGRGTWYAGYLPVSENTDFSIVAKPGKTAVLTDNRGQTVEGTIIVVSPEDCSIWVQVTGETP